MDEKFESCINDDVEKKTSAAVTSRWSRYV